MVPAVVFHTRTCDSNESVFIW